MKKGEKLKVEKPRQYQQGWTEFYKLKFFLTPDSLIPRPETELLVDEILKIKPDTLLDLGTGSGNIAISVAKNLPAGRQGLPGVKIIATDISEKALEVARKNARFHKVENQIIFLKSDLLEYLSSREGLASHLPAGKAGLKGGIVKVPDVIVTNLPYIPTARLLHIDPMVTEWEPRVALDGGIDGFELYRKLFTQMSKLFASQNEQKKSCLPAGRVYPKYLIGEIDDTQGEIAISETKKYFPDAEAEVKTDLAKKQRILSIRF